MTSYVVDGLHHADLSQVDVTKGGVTATNYPPSPRLEERERGYANDIEAEVFGRHIIGKWRNVNDRYFYGSIHLAVLPGETSMEGYYTAVLTDTEVASERWRWARVESGSAAGVDLTTVKLAEPKMIFEMLRDRTRFDGSIPLAQVTEHS